MMIIEGKVKRDSHVCIILTDTVPMDRASIVGHVIGHMDNDLVTPVGNDCWARNRAIDGENYALNAIRSGGDVFDVEPILARYSSIRNNIVVVCRNVVITPARPVRCAVDA